MSFIGELKRRNVFRVAGVYAVVGWLLVQVAATVEEAIELPAWFDAVVLSFLVIGFPIALVFAWAFELTPEAIRRTAAVSPEDSITAQTAGKLDIVLILALLLFTGTMLLPRFFPDARQSGFLDETATLEGADARLAGGGSSGPAVRSDASIAVLPFADLSPEGDQAYFADGISEELLNVLAKVKALKVAGRTSSFAFKGRNEDLREIGRVLNVAHILEGSVRTQGDRVRVTAQLIQVSDGFHLWSETYDGDLSDIFAVQDDIAEQILVALTDQLLAEGVAPLTPAQRTDITAYGLFLEARDLIATRNVANMQRALELLDRAIEIDVAYAPAYAARAQGRLLLTDRPTSYGDIPQHVAYPLVQADIDKALELDPNLAQGHAVLGLISADLGRPEVAIASLQRAVQLNPNSLDARNWLALSLVGSADFRGGLAQLRALIELDPLYEPAVNNAMVYAQELGRVDEAVRIVRDYIRKTRDRGTVAVFNARIAVLEGRIADGIRGFENQHSGDSPDVRAATWLSGAYASIGEFEQARAVPGLTASSRALVATTLKGYRADAEVLGAQLELEPSSTSHQFNYIVALSLSGEDRRLAEFFATSYRGDQALYAQRLRGASGVAELAPFMELALAMRAIGDEDTAREVMARWKAGIDEFRAGGSSSERRNVDEARYWAMAGDGDRSVELLERAFAERRLLPVMDFRDRAFDAIQTHEGFIALRERARGRINEERAKLQLPPLAPAFFVNPLLP